MARHHGSGSLVKRGKWYTAKWMADGKVYTKSTRCANRRDALDRLDEFTKPFREEPELARLENLKARIAVQERAVANAANGKRSPVELKFLIDVFKKDLSTSEISGGTENLYDGMAEAFRKFTGKTYAHEVTEDDAKRFMASVKEKSAVTTYKHYKAVLMRMFEAAMRADGRIRGNPFARIPRLKVQKDVGRRELTQEEVDRLLEVLKRLAEEKDESGLVFPVLKRWYDTNMIKSRIHAVFKAAGIVTFRRVDGKVRIETGFHALRHFFISNCARSGIPVNVIQEMVGHSTPDMSLHYAHVNSGDLSLPDFGEKTVKVRLKRETFGLIEKARGTSDMDDFLKAIILKGGSPGIADVQKARESAEIDEMIGDVFVK